MRVDLQMAKHLSSLNSIESVRVQFTVDGFWGIHLLLLRDGKLESFPLMLAQRGGQKRFASLDTAFQTIEEFWDGPVTVFQE